MKVAVPLLANSPGLLLELKNLIGYVEPSQAPNEVIPKRRLTGQQEDHEIGKCARVAMSTWFIHLMLLFKNYFF